MKKILIANRGEIAIRIIRACQELGIRTVAVHSLVDKDSLHAKLADESVCIGPNASKDSYLNIPAIMSAAEITGVDAIHPGYGFLSESAEFASVCHAYGIKFIGPTAEQIALLGNKVSARGAAIKAKVPLLPGSTHAITDPKEAVALAESMGFPVIIKAAAGGGGKGMKVIWESEELPRMLQITQQEAQKAFGCGDCYIEKYLTHPKHIEVQIIADEHGHVIHLGERDCSIQRRHQKLVEESPCATLSAKERKKVCDLAVRLCESVGYQSLGTVEFLYQDNEFYFMEVNTRLQVEHPVTEFVTRIDLVKEQIKIAQGGSIKHLEYSPKGHSIEVRINAEDPRSFAPWPGKVVDFHAPGGPGVRVDSLLYSGYKVPQYYDSMILKLITFGADRHECLQRMKRSLKELKIEGIRTNIEFHAQLMENEDFASGNVSTNFLQSFVMV